MTKNNDQHEDPYPTKKKKKKKKKISYTCKSNWKLFYSLN